MKIKSTIILLLAARLTSFGVPTSYYGSFHAGGNSLGATGYSGSLSSDLDVFGYNLNNVASINADTANLGNATITNNLTTSLLTVNSNMTLAGTLTVSNMNASQFSITNPANSLAVAMVCTNITGTNYVGWQVQGTNWWIPLN